MSNICDWICKKGSSTSMNLEDHNLVFKNDIYKPEIFSVYYYLIKNSQAVKKGAAPEKAMVKKDVKSKVAAKKWL